MLFGKPADAAGSDQIKSSFTFTLPVDSGPEIARSPFRDPVGLEAMVFVADRMRTDGFKVTRVRPGSYYCAGFDVRLPEFHVKATLDAERTDGILDCILDTHCSTLLWRSVPPEVVSNGWIRCCSAIEGILRQYPGTTSLLWLTQEEAYSD
jgi:hypothetical protein